jgi:hypothetical protein
MSPAAGVLMGLLLSLRSHSTVMRRWPCSVEQIVYLRCAFRSATIRCPRGFLSHVNICRQSASVLRYGTRALVRSFAQRGQYEDVYAAQASARGPVWTPINPADGRADRKLLHEALSGRRLILRMVVPIALKSLAATRR